MASSPRRLSDGWKEEKVLLSVATCLITGRDPSTAEKCREEMPVADK